MGRPRKTAPAKAPAAAPAPAEPPKKKNRPTRTPKNPFEAAQVVEDSDEDPIYTVESIVGVQWVRGERKYQVRWAGYDAQHDTWEPLAHLVGCAEQIREFERKKAEQEAKDKEELLARRMAAKEKAEQHAKDLREKAREAASADMANVVVLDNDNAEESALEVSENGNLKLHKAKTGVVWSYFDLTKLRPTCKCLNATGEGY